MVTAETAAESITVGEVSTTAGSDSYLELVLVAERFDSTLIHVAIIMM